MTGSAASSVRAPGRSPSNRPDMVFHATDPTSSCGLWTVVSGGVRNPASGMSS